MSSVLLQKGKMGKTHTLAFLIESIAHQGSGTHSKPGCGSNLLYSQLSLGLEREQEAVLSAIPDFDGVYDYHQYGKDLWCELRNQVQGSQSRKATHYR